MGRPACGSFLFRGHSAYPRRAFAMVYSILILGATSFAISWLGTLAMRSLAPRFGFVDKPGHRKIHRQPIPLGGGVAIFWAYVLPMLAAVIPARGLAPPRP